MTTEQEKRIRDFNLAFEDKGIEVSFHLFITQFSSNTYESFGVYARLSGGKLLSLFEFLKSENLIHLSFIGFSTERGGFFSFKTGVFEQLETVLNYFEREFKCQTCKKKEPLNHHTCPYKEDINGDKETLCNCCESCQQNCIDDI